MQFLSSASYTRPAARLRNFFLFRASTIYKRRQNCFRTYGGGDQHLDGTLKDGTNFTAVIPLGKMPDLADRLEANNVQLEAELPATPPWWVALLPNLVFVVLLALVWLFIMNQMQGGSNRALSFGKSKARLYLEEKGK